MLELGDRVKCFSTHSDTRKFQFIGTIVFIAGNIIGNRYIGVVEDEENLFLWPPSKGFRASFTESNLKAYEFVEHSSLEQLLTHYDPRVRYLGLRASKTSLEKSDVV